MLFNRMLVNGPYRNINDVMTSSGSQLRYAGTAAQFSAGGASHNWINLNNILGNDTSSYTSSDTVADNGGADGFTYRVELTNYGFSIPTGVTITGMQVLYTFSTSMNSTADLCFSDYAQFIVGGTKVGTNRGDYTIYLPDLNWLTIETDSLGGSTDLWGLTPTPAEINASNFGFAFQFENDGQPSRDADIRMYALGIEVFYE